MKQLLLIALIGSVGLLAAADRGKDIGPRPNEPIAKAAIMKFTGGSGRCQTEPGHSGSLALRSRGSQGR